MNKRWILWGVMGVTLGFGSLSALNVYITNDNADMVNWKKICVRLSLDKDEAALYQDALCISVDTPDIELKGWRTTAQAPVHYAESFKKNKRLFTESFNLEILIDFEKSGKQGQIFNQANLSISSLVLTKSGKTKAENVVVPLKVTNIAEDLALTATTSLLALVPEYTSTLLPYQRSLEYFKNNKRIVGKLAATEVLVMDRLKDLWRRARVMVWTLISSISFYKWYFVLWILLLLLLLRWFFPVFRFVVPLSVRWYREVVILVSISLLILTWWLVRYNIGLDVWYGVLGTLCIPGSCYYLWGGTETFLDRFKVLIGIIFAVALLPLLALAFMHSTMDALLRFLK